MSFDRRRPLYRCFDMEDGTTSWWTVVADNTPGRALTPEEVEGVEAALYLAPWRDGFFDAFAKHRKATIYSNQQED